MKRRNLLVVQGGGPTRVLNLTLATILERARARGSLDRILEARFGATGVAAGDVIDLERISLRPANWNRCPM